MISSQQALDIIINNAPNFGVEEIPFLEAVGRILKEDIVADRDFPPFNRVSMDGIAIKFSAFQKGNRNFTIEGIQPAGSPQLTLQNSENCLEVMTGAMLPENTDTVIRYEDVTIKNGIATINIESINANQNVHAKGKDRQQNDVLINKNTLIAAAEVGVLATVGKVTVKVAKQPKVIIISTGDELVGVDENPLPHQIRRSNVFTLVSLLERLHIKAETLHIVDDKPLLKQKIADCLQKYDVLLFSGAVSKGKFDFLPEILEELGVEKLFHKVAQRPGKPFWFGRKASFGTNEQNVKEQKTIFAFPGNPVSTFVGCLKYFYPWYFASAEVDYSLPTAELTEDFEFKPALTYFLQVKLSHENGKILATPVVGNGSGDLANLVNADAFLELPADETQFKKGQVFPLLLYR